MMARGVKVGGFKGGVKRLVDYIGGDCVKVFVPSKGNVKGDLNVIE